MGRTIIVDSYDAHVGVVDGTEEVIVPLPKSANVGDVLIYPDGTCEEIIRKTYWPDGSVKAVHTMEREPE